MSLIRCLECGREISDKSKSCIGCGCPMEHSMQNLNQQDFGMVENGKNVENSESTENTYVNRNVSDNLNAQTYSTDNFNTIENNGEVNQTIQKENKTNLKTAAAYKEMGRNDIKNNWQTAIAISALHFAIVMLALGFVNLILAFIFGESFFRFFISSLTDTNTYFIAVIIYLVMSLIVAPLSYGLSIYTLELKRGKNPDLNTSFCGFDRYKDVIIARIIAFGIIVLSIVVISIVTALVIIVFLAMFIDILSSSIEYTKFFGIICYIALFATILGTFFIVKIRLAFTFFIMRDSEKATPMDCIRQSNQLMSGKTLKYLGLNMIFVSSWIFNIISLLASYIFVFLPHLSVSSAYFYEDCVRDAVANGKLNYVQLNDEAKKSIFGIQSGDDILSHNTFQV